jgi:hypothetical protein
MSVYKPFFQLTIKHNYFVDGLCHQLDFVAIEKTCRLMKNANLIVRSNSAGMNIFADLDQADTLALFTQDEEEPFELEFKVFCTDPYFSNYTDIPVLRSSNVKQAALFFFEHDFIEQDILETPAIAEPNPIKLHQEKFVSESDLLMVSTLRKRGLVSHTDVQNKLCFVVKINIKHSAIKYFITGKHSPNFVIDFQAKSTIWKYYVMGLPLNEQVFITDLDEKINFKAAGEELLPGGKQAFTFQSDRTLVLQARSHYRFQLKIAQRNGSKVLIKQLPVASASQLYQVIIDGNKSALSEIYVNC